MRLMRIRFAKSIMINCDGATPCCLRCQAMASNRGQYLMRPGVKANLNLRWLSSKNRVLLQMEAVELRGGAGGIGDPVLAVHDLHGVAGARPARRGEVGGGFQVVSLRAVRPVDHYGF